MLATRCKVGWIKEQFPITTMGLDMIHFSGSCLLADLQTIHTPGICGKMIFAHRPPLWTVIQLLYGRIADNALGGMSWASATLDQHIAAWIGAFAQRPIWHQLSQTPISRCAQSIECQRRAIPKDCQHDQMDDSQQDLVRDERK